MLLLGLMPMTVSAAVRVVGPGCTYTALATALADAQPGDEIRVLEGVRTINALVAVDDLSLRGGFANCGDGTPQLAGQTTLRSAASGLPVLRIAPGVTGVLLERLELTGADNPAGAGGRGEGGGLSLGAGSGAALRVMQIAGNQAGRGAGVFVESGAELLAAGGLNTRISIVDNIASEAGGGVFLDTGAIVDLADNAALTTSLERNDAGTLGGAVYVSGGAGLWLNGARVVGNSAAASGGGIAVQGGQLHLVDGLLQDNLANYGGGLSLQDARVTALEGTRFSGNVANNRGGGIDARQVTSPLTIRASHAARAGLGQAPVFENNRAGSMGGGALFYSSTTGMALWIENASGAPARFAGNTSAGAGGALMVNGAFAELPQHVEMVDNMAGTHGGAVWATAGATVWVRADVPDWLARFSGNVAGGNGGAFAASGSALLLDWVVVGDAPFSPNRALRGGGIHVNNGSLRLRNARVRSNSASLLGGGIVMNSNGDHVIAGVLGSGQLAGAQPLPRCQPLLLPADRYCSEVASNQVPGPDGRGGGVVAAFTGSVQISHTALQVNAAAAASALDIGQETRVLLDTVLVSGHSRAVAVGAQGELAMQSSTLAGNGPDTLWLDDAGGTRLAMYDSILWDNSGGLVGGASATIDGDCNVTQSLRIPGMQMDPGFVTTARGAYRLGGLSPARDLCPAGASLDLDGQARPDGLNADAGAFEVTPDSPVLFVDGFE